MKYVLTHENVRVTIYDTVNQMIQGAKSSGEKLSTYIDAKSSAIGLSAKVNGYFEVHQISPYDILRNYSLNEKATDEQIDWAVDCCMRELEGVCELSEPLKKCG